MASARFSYVRYDERSTARQEHFKKLFEAIEEFAEKTLTDSRSRSLLMTALEEAYMWTGKAIRDDQIKRGADPEHVPARG